MSNATILSVPSKLNARLKKINNGSRERFQNFKK